MRPLRVLGGLKYQIYRGPVCEPGKSQNIMKIQFMSQTVSPASRGGRLTSLHCLPDVLSFEEHRQKHRRQCSFQNIAKKSHR